MNCYKRLSYLCDSSCTKPEQLFNPSDWVTDPVTPPYTAPQKREWVELTEEEIRKIIETHTFDDHGFEIWCDGLSVIKAVTEILKEKNA